MKLKITPHPLAGRVQAGGLKVRRAPRDDLCGARRPRNGPDGRRGESGHRGYGGMPARTRRSARQPDGRHWRIAPVRCPAEEGTIDCGESGSTLRFLLPLIPALGLRRTVTGSGRLPQRPLSPLRELLEEHGALIEGKALPLELSGDLRRGVTACREM